MSINVRTEDNFHYKFHPVSSNQINIRVKAPKEAQVILAREPEESSPCYEIIFGDWNNSRTVIRKDGFGIAKVTAKTPGILSKHEYKNFWIRWDSSLIAAGVPGDSTPLVSYHDPKLFTIRYFGVRTSLCSTGEWFIDTQQYSYPSPQQHSLPYPQQQSSQLAGLQQHLLSFAAGMLQPPANPYYPPQPSAFPPPTSGLRWASGADGSIPPGAVIGGYDVGGETLYVARAFCESGVLPGKFVPSHRVTYVAWGGQEIAKNVYEILCDVYPRWVSTSGAGVPHGAVICGRTENGESLYVGRAHHEGSLVPGKVQLSHGVCYIPFGGNEVAKPQYEILTV